MIEQKFHVRFDELNADGHIPAAAFLKYFQEAAALDSNSMGFGWETLQKDNLAWVLTHMQARALKPVIAHQDVTLKTRHVYSDKLFSRRQFTVLGQDGEPLFEGSSWWVLMDTQKRRLSRNPQNLLDLNPAEREELEPEENFKAPLPADTPAHTLRVITREEDLDINGHVNNTHYAAWAVESVPREARQGKTLDRILLSFKNECRAGETIRIDVYPDGSNGFWHTLTREEDGKEAARVFTRWK